MRRRRQQPRQCQRLLRDTHAAAVTATAACGGSLDASYGPQHTSAVRQAAPLLRAASLGHSFAGVASSMWMSTTGWQLQHRRLVTGSLVDAYQAPHLATLGTALHDEAQHTIASPAGHERDSNSSSSSRHVEYTLSLGCSLRWKTHRLAVQRCQHCCCSTALTESLLLLLGCCNPSTPHTDSQAAMHLLQPAPQSPATTATPPART